jgi:hypothetical protein
MTVSVGIVALLALGGIIGGAMGAAKNVVAYVGIGVCLVAVAVLILVAGGAK